MRTWRDAVLRARCGAGVLEQHLIAALWRSLTVTVSSRRIGQIQFPPGSKKIEIGSVERLVEKLSAIVHNETLATKSGGDCRLLDVPELSSQLLPYATRCRDCILLFRTEMSGMKTKQCKINTI